MESTEANTPAAAPETSAASAPVAGPQPYAFSQQSLFSGPELRKLNADFQEIRRGCATRLAVLFRTEFELTLASLQTPMFRQFAGAVAQPTHLTMFKAEPLRGIGVVEISPALALTLSDRLMGGPGDANLPARELTEIEIALLDQVVQLFIETWCAHWAGWRELKPTLLGHESDGRYLQTSPADSSLLVARFEAKVGEAAGHVSLALPFATIEPLIQKLRAELQPPAEASPATPAPVKSPAWNTAFDNMRIAVNAELPGPQITARELPKLKVGDVLPFPAESANLVQLRVGGTTRFTGRLGTREDQWAVEVLDVLKS
jgi:flagellar motor switch protein FliM